MQLEHKVIVLETDRFDKAYERPHVIADIVCPDEMDIRFQRLQHGFRLGRHTAEGHEKIPFASAYVGKPADKPFDLIMVMHMEMDKNPHILTNHPGKSNIFVPLLKIN